jgi:hypothetical protein
MKKYAFIFSVSYLAIATLLAFIAESLKIKAGASFGFSAIFAASLFASWMFTRDRQREPTVGETKTYAWQSLSGLWLVSLLVAGIAISIFATVEELKILLELLAMKWFLGAMTFGALLISAISYIVIRWSFGWYARMAFKSVNAAG